MIRLGVFIETDPTVITAGKDIEIKVSYVVDGLDESQTITTSYVGTEGCTVREPTTFNNDVNVGTNNLTDFIRIDTTAIGECQIQLMACTQTEECDSKSVHIAINPPIMNIASIVESFSSVKLKPAFMFDTEHGPVLIKESKAKIHKYLKNRGYAFDKSKKLWKK